MLCHASIVHKQWHVRPVVQAGSLNITWLCACRNGDLLYTFTDAEDDMQLFWEAFPAAGGGRTTYMFTYADADAKRPTFEVWHLCTSNLCCCVKHDDTVHTEKAPL